MMRRSSVATNSSAQGTISKRDFLEKLEQVTKLAFKKDNENKQLTAALEAKDRELDQLLALLNQSEGRVAAQNKQAQLAENLSTSLREELEQIQSDFERVSKEVADLRAELDLRSGLLNSERERVNVLQEQKALAELRLHDLETQCAQHQGCQQELDAKVKQLEDYKQQLEERVKENTELKAATEEIAALKSALAARDKAATELSGRVESLVAALTEKSSQLSQAKEEFEAASRTWQHDREALSKLVNQRTQECATLRSDHAICMYFEKCCTNQ